MKHLIKTHTSVLCFYIPRSFAGSSMWLMQPVTVKHRLMLEVATYNTVADYILEELSLVLVGAKVRGAAWVVAVRQEELAAYPGSIHAALRDLPLPMRGPAQPRGLGDSKGRREDYQACEAKYYHGRGKFSAKLAVACSGQAQT